MRGLSALVLATRRVCSHPHKQSPIEDCQGAAQDPRLQPLVISLILAELRSRPHPQESHLAVERQHAARNPTLLMLSQTDDCGAPRQISGLAGGCQQATQISDPQSLDAALWQVFRSRPHPQETSLAPGAAHMQPGALIPMLLMLGLTGSCDEPTPPDLQRPGLPICSPEA